MNKNSIHRWYLKLLLPHRWRLLLAVLLVSLHSLCPAAVVFLTEAILDNALLQAKPQAINWLPATIVLLYFLNGGLHVLRSMITRKIAWQLVTDVRKMLFDSLIHAPIQWRKNQKLGEILSSLSDDVSAMQYMVSAVVTLVQKPLSIAALLCSAYAMHPSLTLIAIIAMPLFLLPVRWLKKKLRLAAARELDALSDLRAQAAESFSHFSDVQMQRAENRQIDLFQHRNQELYRQKIHYILLQVSTSPIMELIAATGVGAALYVGATQVAQGDRSPSEILAFLVAIGLLSAPLKGLSEALPLWEKATVAASRVRLMLDTEPISNNGTLELPAVTSLQFEEVDFEYPGEAVFQQLSLDIAIGARTVIKGESGSGKTTAMQLILRLLEPQKGQVLLNGQAITEFPLKDYRSLFAVLSQDALLFHDTILSNLCLGRAIGLDEVQQACKGARIHDFIEGQDKGYQSSVSEMGSALSGGQRQRICIARALLSNAPILILDEPFAALDLPTQHSIWETIDSLYSGRTIILMTHQPWLWEKADHCILLD